MKYVDRESSFPITADTTEENADLQKRCEKLFSASLCASVDLLK
jgi:hypothetical protein